MAWKYQQGVITDLGHWWLLRLSGGWGLSEAPWHTEAWDGGQAQNDFVKTATGALDPSSVGTEQNIISSVTKYLLSAELMSREKESVTEK